jgi:hypothetical protein
MVQQNFSVVVYQQLLEANLDPDRLLNFDADPDPAEANNWQIKIIKKLNFKATDKRAGSVRIRNIA